VPRWIWPKSARFGRATGFDMLIKGMVIFLAVMAGLAMFGKLRLPGLHRRRAALPGKCRRCGRPRIGKGPCPCTTKSS